MNSVTVVFSNPTGSNFSLGPLTGVYLQGRELRESRDGAVLATDSNFRWITQGGSFSRFDCDVRCYVQLENGRERVRYGPYRGFSSLNGLKFVDHQLFCVYDEQHKDWYGYESGQHWDAILVIAAETETMRPPGPGT